MSKKSIFALLGTLIMVAPLSSCGASSNKKTILRVLNMEDYIYEQDIDEGYENPDLTDQFVSYIENDPDLYAKYGDVEVIYDTTDTNETLYSEMQTGKAIYDLICPSDYMIQKLISVDMLEPLDKSLIPTYYGTVANNYEDTKACTLVKDVFDNISATIMKTGEEVYLKDYAVGYMWGTLGILFNPEYKSFIKRGYSVDEVITDMSSWNSLWGESNDNKYKGTISIKDSMRDTYAIGVIHTFYEEEIKPLYDAYNALRDSGTATDSAIEEAYNAYKEKFDTVFNWSDLEHVKEVEKELNLLKKNIFGLEVDSGKEDIITDKIGINLAWSGDAVYSMDQGEDELKVGDDLKSLCYSIPQEGSNLWFDAWVMPKLKENQRSELQRDLAHEFLNFICKTDGFTIVEDGETIEYDAPVAQNMNYIGYTSFMGGDYVLSLVTDWFDARVEETYISALVKNHTYEDYDVLVKLDEDDYRELSIEDCMKATHDSALDSKELYYFAQEDNGFVKEGYHPVYKLDDDGEETETIKTYGDLLIADAYFDDPNQVEIINHGVEFNPNYTAYGNSGIQRVNLSIYFDGTLEDLTDEDMYIYTTTYYCVDEDMNASSSVGRQFYCQYPDLETLNRCSVMKDYGKNNANVMNMWERFKSNSLPLWAIILFIAEIAVLISFVLYFLIAKNVKKKLRIKRKVAAK